ncbi:MAG: BON domain-containing protein [Gammaproteobacteria bacterium]
MTIATREGVVTLTGEVGSLTQRRLAEVLTWWTAGCELVPGTLVAQGDRYYARCCAGCAAGLALAESTARPSADPQAL